MITLYRILNDKTVPVNEHHAMMAWPHSEKYDGKQIPYLTFAHTYGPTTFSDLHRQYTRQFKSRRCSPF